ncbi:hypothetical protein DL546_001740 [Coniochaeta pulveracea]|uniref:Uncharacterized protein n=1 Tax=Coniochaeta pulveracea TaxID=177199 RepID=A0A420XWS1_9PEZI|nr:hypothetical protein DL546_001740 [Coniochaeta pulveracea]
MKLGNLLAVLAQAIGIKKTQIIGPENQLSSRSEPTDPRSGLGFLAEGCGTAWSVNDGILEAGCDDQVCGKRVKTHLDLRNWCGPSPSCRLMGSRYSNALFPAS